MSCRDVLQVRGWTLRPDADAAHIRLEPELSNIGVARLFVRERLVGQPDHVVDDAALLASELVTNAILHVKTSVVMGVLTDADQVLVTVTDERHDRLPRLGRMPIAEDVVEMSRGIAIVCAIASDFGWQLLHHSPGKVVWFTLALERPRAPILLRG
jgi:anti-sigma regulatory factor (Ser/Thr protein kinase)